MELPTFERFYGVDFSGAREAGVNTWVAELEPTRRGFALTSLRSLADICGTAERGVALGHLVDLILATERSLWGFDFPFGLPVELFPHDTPWADQFAFLAEWGEDAYGCGVECVRRATELLQRKHVMRAADTEARTPFDTFQYRKLRTARRVVVECCPGSVLKRVKVPHQNYKQPAGGPLTRRRRLTRHAILEWLSGEVRIDDRFRRVMMRNPGGDALDAVIAAVGAALAVEAADHRAIARHPRYPREGHLYV